MRIFTSILLLITIYSCSNKQDQEEVLLYLSVRNKDYNIYKNNLNGTEEQLTVNPGFDYAPMWNNSLKTIFYYSYVEDTFLVASMNLEGEKLDAETYGQQEFNLSPNGKYLIAQISEGDYSALVLTTIEGSNPDTIALADSYNGRAKWSNQSDQIAYISDRDGNNEVYLYRLDEKSTIRLTNNSTFEKYLTWSPDGSRIAYSTQYYEEGKPDRNDLFVLNIAEFTTSQITDDSFNDTELAWSPISDRIAFHSNRSGGDHIFVMKSDGSNITQISKEHAYHCEPCWAIQ